MKIVRVEPFFVDRWLLVKVETDEGIIGYGESTLWAHLEAVEAAIRKLGSFLIGKDPFRIEHHSQLPFRRFHFRGGVLSSAMAAIDIALWDILGKSAKLPIYQLLGGKYREKCRTFWTVGGSTPEEAAEAASKAVKRGFTVLRIWPFGSGGPRIISSLEISEAVDTVRAVREAVGDRIDLGVEIHRRFTPIQAVTFAREIEKYRILFMEDPIAPESIGAMLYVARRTSIPIAAGERCFDLYGFKELIERGIVGLIRPDFTVAGGITEGRKIAAIAEASGVGIMPHLMSSPIGTAAFLHIDASIPNYAFQEHMEEGQGIRGEITKPALKDEPGYAHIPEGPGLGIELDEEAIKKYPRRRQEAFQGLYYEDGSLADF